MLRSVRAPGIPVVRPRILSSVPHDPFAQTQGLAYVQGSLYESTGLVGSSTLRRIDIASGAVLESRPVPDVWAEGIASAGEEIVQITYTERMALVYRVADLQRKRILHYEGEGWGLAAYGGGYIMSDGSSVLTWRDVNFEAMGNVEVHLRGRPLTGINDLESAYEKIYANVLFHNDIYEIDPRTGKVMRLIDCTELTDLARQGTAALDLNGIAYAADRNAFFVTGKKWPLLFEVTWTR
jgi:glutaminyl-peptide cyclotransferase